MADKPKWCSVVDHESHETHVFPLDDLVEHDVAQGAEARCICGPRTGLLVTDHGDYYEFVHHSLDGRERHEPAA